MSSHDAVRAIREMTFRTLLYQGGFCVSLNIPLLHQEHACPASLAFLPLLAVSL
jgi:hypothetical protein